MQNIGVFGIPAIAHLLLMFLQAIAISGVFYITAYFSSSAGN